MADNNSNWIGDMIRGLEKAQEKRVWDKDRFPDLAAPDNPIDPKLQPLEDRADDLTRAIDTLTAKREQPSEHINIYGDLRGIAVRLRRLCDRMHVLPRDEAERILDDVTNQLEELLLKG